MQRVVRSMVLRAALALTLLVIGSLAVQPLHAAGINVTLLAERDRPSRRRWMRHRLQMAG